MTREEGVENIVIVQGVRVSGPTAPLVALCQQAREPLPLKHTLIPPRYRPDMQRPLLSEAQNIHGM